jgi:hypothetical protein
VDIVGITHLLQRCLTLLVDTIIQWTAFQLVRGRNPLGSLLRCRCRLSRCVTRRRDEKSS